MLAAQQIVTAEHAHRLRVGHFVNVRRTPGGPAPEETARASELSHRQLEADEGWWNGGTVLVEGAIIAALWWFGRTFS